MSKLQRVDYVVIHCSDSSWGDAAVIDSWHKDRGWKRDDDRNGVLRHIGYHYVVLNGVPTYDLAKRHEIRPEYEGRIECGRDDDEAGAHVVGLNKNSIGICLIGRSLPDFTETQLERAAALAALIVRRPPRTREFPLRVAPKIVGHCETESGKAQGKTCPVIDMDAFRRRVAKHLATVDRVIEQFAANAAAARGDRPEWTEPRGTLREHIEELRAAFMGASTRGFRK